MDNSAILRRTVFLTVAVFTAILVVPATFAQCSCSTSSYTGAGECGDGIACESQYCAHTGGGSGCETCVACSCYNIRCECPDGVLVTETTCVNNSCSPCGSASVQRRGGLLAWLKGGKHTASGDACSIERRQPPSGEGSAGR